MFRVLGSIEALNELMNLNLTHYDVNWIYNLHNLKGQGYYLKSRHSKVRLIQCLPISNKGLKDDFLIFSGQWHDDLPCPVKEGTLGGGLIIKFCDLTLFNFLHLCYSLSLLEWIFIGFNDIADPHAFTPSLRLVNKASLDRIL